MNLEVIKISKLLYFLKVLDYCQFMYYALFGNKVSLRSLTNKAGEDVMESDQTCVCMYGVN